VTDVTELGSPVDAQGWAGVTAASRANGCLKAELRRSADPTAYDANLDAVAKTNDLVIAGSFLLTEAVATVARRHPGVRFLLVDPLVAPASEPNLSVIAFREDQAAFLAGALAAMVSQSRVLGGIYSLEGGAMTRYRNGFELGAHTIDPAIRVLGVYQGPEDGTPFGNPTWGAQQARTLMSLGADVIFGAGGTTGQGALPAAARANRLCIGAGIDDFASDPPARPCLLTSAVTHIDRAVETTVVDAAGGRWAGGLRQFGISDSGVGLAPFHELEPRVTPEMRRRLGELASELATGTLSAG